MSLEAALACPLAWKQLPSGSWTLGTAVGLGPVSLCPRSGSRGRRAQDGRALLFPWRRRSCRAQQERRVSARPVWSLLTPHLPRGFNQLRGPQTGCTQSGCRAMLERHSFLHGLIT